MYKASNDTADSAPAKQDQLDFLMIIVLTTCSSVYMFTAEHIHNCMFSFTYVCFPSHRPQAELLLDSIKFSADMTLLALT